MEARKINIDRTRRHGLPAAWESGGGMRNTGEAIIWAEPDGKPPRPVYIRRKGHLANGEHALVLVRPGMFRVWAYQHRGDFTISVYRVKDVLREGDDFVALVEKVYSFDQGEWTPEEPPELIRPAIKAAMDKATCYHCREPHYVFSEKQEEVTP